MNKTTKLIAAGATALASIGSLSAPASASVSTNNCTLTALRPQVNGQYVRAYGTVHCGVSRLVTAQAALMEDDPTSDDTISMSSWGGPWRVAAGGRLNVTGPWVHCPNTEAGSEELYSKIRIIVDNVVVGWDTSLIQPFSC